MSGDTEIGSPRPRPLSGGFWTLLSWLRREDPSSSNESLSSAGSDRTAVSFAFLNPAHYHGSAPPLAVPPPGPPTDTYKQRVRERNLRRQYDRGITLHRKYGLFRGDGLGGVDASTLPPPRRAQAAAAQERRERRAISECYQRRAAHVPGKRRAPLPPPGRGYLRCDSLEPGVSNSDRRPSRKRPAPQPPVKIDKPTENNTLDKTAPTSASDRTDRDDVESTGRDILTDCKPEKYTKKDINKTKPEKNFLKQIFENKKRNYSIDVTTVKVLPSISELDAQAAEIIETNKLKNTNAMNHQTIIQAIKENFCAKCFKKPCICVADTMSSNVEQSRNKNASTYTQTENALRKSTAIKNDKLDEKQKLKEMLKEMKDSLPKKANPDNIKNNVINAHSNQSNNRMAILEAPTLRIGSKSGSHADDTTKQASSLQVSQISQQKDELRKKTNKQEIKSGNVENRTTPISNNISILNTAIPKPSTGNNAQDASAKLNKNINTPLKMSSLLNPIYIPKDTTHAQNSAKKLDEDVSSNVPKPDSSDKAKKKTANAVRDIVLNSALTKNPMPSSSKPLKSYKLESNISTPRSNRISAELTQSATGQVAPGKAKNEHFNGERLSHHLRRRELVTMLEQSIAKGDERTAAEAASKLAQLRLTCSVLSFTSHILSEPSSSKTQIENKLPQEQINNLKSPSLISTNLAAAARTKSLSNEPIINVGYQVKEENRTEACTSGSNISPRQASTSKELCVGTTTDSADITIDVWVEDKEKARGPIKIKIKRAAVVGDLRRQAEQSLGLPVRLQRWIIGRTLCTNDDTPLISLAGPAVNAPFYLYLVESDANKENDLKLPTINKTENKSLQSDELEKKASDVYTELVKLERQALVPNAEVFECEICMEQCKSGDGVVLRECVHSFCKGCLVDVIRHCEEPAVPCPATGCPGELHEREIRALVCPEDYERWLARGLAAAESGTRNAFHCRTKDCTGWALCEVGVRRFPCPVCKHTNCVPCQTIHKDETCEQHRAKLLAAAATNTADGTDEGTRALIESLITRGEALQCPECSAIITKKWGCDWVKCSACKTEICWVTRGRRWGPAGRGDTTGGCKCGVDGKRCHPACGYCH